MALDFPNSPSVDDVYTLSGKSWKWNGAGWQLQTTTGGAGGDLLSSLLSAEISVTGATTATIGRMHVCSGTTADYTVTLPAASGNTGKLIGFRMAPGLTKLVTLDGNASETIDNALTRVMWAGETAILLCDGSNWFKIAGKSIAMTAQMDRNSAQSISTATVTKVDLNNTDFNSGGVADSATNHRMDIRRPAKYFVTGSWYFSGLGNVHTQSRIHVNGAEAKTELLLTNGALPATLPIVSEVFDLVAGDYVELYVYHENGSNVNTDTASVGTKPRLTLIESLAW